MPQWSVWDRYQRSIEAHEDDEYPDCESGDHPTGSPTIGKTRLIDGYWICESCDAGSDYSKQEG